MKSNGEADVSDVPRLMESSRPNDWLGARAALFDANESLLDKALSENRAMSQLESREFDINAGQIKAINGKLAEYKRWRTEQCEALAAAGFGSGLGPVLPF